MKNIQVIDGALNTTFSIFQATDEEVSLLFPEPRQGIQYAGDLDAQTECDEIDGSGSRRSMNTRRAAERARSPGR